MPKKLLRKINPKARLIIIAVVFLAILGATAYFLVNRTSDPASNLPNDVVFKIDNKEYSNAEVEELIRWPVSYGSSKNDAAKLVFEHLKKTHAAETLNYVPLQEITDRTKKEVSDRITQAGAKPSDYSSWVELVGKANAIDSSLNQDLSLGAKGHSYVFYFGQHQQYDPENKIAGAGDASLIAADRANADARAKYYHAQINDKKLSADAAYQVMIKDEPKTLVRFSKIYDAASIEGLRNEIYFQSVLESIQKQTTIGLSDIKVGKALSTATNKDEDMYFYFINVTNAPQKQITTEEINKKIDTFGAVFKGFDS